MVAQSDMGPRLEFLDREECCGPQVSHVDGWETSLGVAAPKEVRATGPLVVHRPKRHAQHVVNVAAPHPAADAERTKQLAQLLASEAVSLVLPAFRSVDLEQVAEFRHQVQPLVRPFRIEMVRLTIELAGAIAAGASDVEIRAMAQVVVNSKVAPALDDLARQLRGPVRPFHKLCIDAAEVGLAAASSTLSPQLSIGWALLRGAKIASEYVTGYRTRDGKRRAGLACLLAIGDHRGASSQSTSDWDSIDWRCSGSVTIKAPNMPLTEKERQAFGDQPKNGELETRLRLFQTKWSGEFFRPGRRQL